MVLIPAIIGHELITIYEIIGVFEGIEINFSKNKPVFSFNLPFFGFMR